MCLVGGMLIVGYGYRLTKVTTSKWNSFIIRF